MTWTPPNGHLPAFRLVLTHRVAGIMSATGKYSSGAAVDFISSNPSRPKPYSQKHPSSHISGALSGTAVQVATQVQFRCWCVVHTSVCASPIAIHCIAITSTLRTLSSYASKPPTFTSPRLTPMWIYIIVHPLQSRGNHQPRLS